MTCPFGKFPVEKNEGEEIDYHEYLMLGKILDAQRMVSAKKAEEDGAVVGHDEHLFIIIHQTYELWFKQILYDLDLVRDELTVCEAHEDYEHINTTEIIKRLNRIVMILKVLNDQVHVLETMSAMDFLEFRDYLTTASGFQSLQFRILENKLGMKPENRTVKFNQSYTTVFRKDENALDEIQKSLTEPTLLRLVERWLEHTPHVEHLWAHYRATVEEDLKQQDDDRKRQNFETVFNEEMHNALMKRGERKLSLKAMQAAIVISLYKDTPMFSTSHHIIMLLIDIDAGICKWRFNHMAMVQRMIGSIQLGTGGSSGYQYLRSTLSDRYKPFVDLANAATFLIHKELLMNSYKRMSYTRRCKHAINQFEISKKFAKCACGNSPKRKTDFLVRNEINHILGVNGDCTDFMDNYNSSNSSEDERKDVESSYESTSSSS